MILRKTGDALERSNRINRILTIIIVLLAFLLAVDLLIIWGQYRRRSEFPQTEIASIDRIEQRISWNGIQQGLNIGYYGPYGFAPDRAHQDRWALSEYYAERFLENAWRHIGNTAEADAAHERAMTWAEQTGSLSTEEAEEALHGEVWP